MAQTPLDLHFGSTGTHFSAAQARSTQAASTIQVPSLGYLTSESQRILRPILGAPGAVVLGDPIALPDKLTRLSIAPGQQYALTEFEGASELGVMPLNVDSAGASAGHVQPIPGTFAHSDRLAFSPSGSVAVIYSAAVQQAQIVNSLPLSAQKIRQIHLIALGGVPVTSLAVSDDAELLLVGVSDGTTGQVWLFAGEQPGRQLMNVGVPSALRFFAGKQDAVVADSSLKQVSILTALAQQVNSRVLAGAAQGLSAPADLEISSDQNRVWVADAGNNGLLGIELSSGTVTATDCPFAPGGFTRLIGTSVFLISSGGTASVGLWAPDALNSRVWRLAQTRSE
jgi:DNA-binding beta-propeller fold protein YncE